MFMSNGERKIVNRIIKLFTPYKKEIIMIILCIIMSTGVSTIVPLISKKLMDEGVIAQNFERVVILSLILILIMLVNQALGILETKYQSYISNVIPYDLNKKAFKHTLRLKMQYLNDTNFAELMSNIGMDIGNISRISDRNTFFVIACIFRIIGGLCGLLVINWRLAIFVLSIVPFKYLITNYLAKLKKRLFEKLMVYNREYAAWYGDNISGVKEVKLWAIERVKIGQFIKHQRKIINGNIKTSYIDKANEISDSTLIYVLSCGISILGAWLIFNDHLTIGGLSAFTIYSSYVTAPISTLINIKYNFSNVLPSAKRLFEFFEIESELSETKGLPKHLDKRITGSIEFDNVSFSYSKNGPLIKNISFKIEHGEKVAIIGPNGSGKTTIINLLLRLYKPDLGRILIDGMDINSLPLCEYRQLISVVTQDAYLFNISIKENIALSGKIDDHTIIEASTNSSASKFIEMLPEKYNSIVGRNGGKLSGGERQKVAMARAFAKDSKVVILDEATAHYDIESEEFVNYFIRSNYVDTTVILISHKPSILKSMDKIILLGEGGIRDIGRHDDLYNNNEQYRLILERSNECA